MTKEQVLKLIEGRVDTMTALAIESIELIYNAEYNEGIEDALRVLDNYDDKERFVEIRKLKK